ncbi:hypothetical protein MMPV_002483 [Pyropia vietnamensis]
MAFCAAPSLGHRLCLATTFRGYPLLLLGRPAAAAAAAAAAAPGRRRLVHPLLVPASPHLLPPTDGGRRHAHHPSHPPSPTCAASSDLPREEVLKTATGGGVDRALADKAVRLAERALTTWETTVSDFFVSPPDRAALVAAFAPVADLVVGSVGGGGPTAERRVLAFARAETVGELVDGGGEREAAAATIAGVDPSGPVLPDTDDAVTALEVRGAFLFDKASHRDFLGAVLGVGLDRAKVGDILVQGETGAQVLVTPDVADAVCALLTSVRTVKVTVTRIPLADLAVRPPTVKELTTVEASMRLDAVASAGFGVSRSKMAAAVKGGDVLVNWREVGSASKALQGGDIVTYRGRGRLEIGEVERTAKGRHRVAMTRFV